MSSFAARNNMIESIPKKLEALIFSRVNLLSLKLSTLYSILSKTDKLNGYAICYRLHSYSSYRFLSKKQIGSRNLIMEAVPGKHFPNTKLTSCNGRSCAWKALLPESKVYRLQWEELCLEKHSSLYRSKGLLVKASPRKCQLPEPES